MLIIVNFMTAILVKKILNSAKFISKTFSNYKNVISNANQKSNVDICESEKSQKIINDLIKFLSTKEGADITPYAYFGNDAYDKLIMDCSDYYLTSDEIALIKNNSNKFTEYFKDIDTIIELGPGSQYAVNNKTLPILSCATNLKRFLPLDINISYLTDVCDIISKEIPNIEIIPKEFNFLDISENQIFDGSNFGKKAMLFLGGTLGNFTVDQQNLIIKKLYNILAPQDLLFITFDTNLDKETLLKAYDNEYCHNFIKTALEFFGNYCPDLKKNLNYLESQCKWNDKDNFIEISYFPIKDLVINISQHKKIIIKKNQKLSGARSRKYCINNVIALLNHNNFKVKDILNNSNKMKIYICQKI